MADGTRVYLDYNATAPVWPEAADAVAEALARAGNASSIHEEGRAARARIEAARRAVAALAAAEPETVVFTGGGTEANNQAIRARREPRLLVSAIEHESALLADADAERIPVLPEGVVDLAALERMLAAAEGPVLAAVMLANNETGVVQPVAEIARLVHAHGGRVHCDAVQAAGKIPVDAAALGADSYALSAHKIGGPQGVGALVLRTGTGVGRFVHGGSQERGLRAGTENAAGIAGFGAAAGVAAARLDDFRALAALRDRLEARLAATVPGTVVFGADAPRLPNTSKHAMPGVESRTQVIAMDLEGVSISAGSACASGKAALPHVLEAMAAPEAAASSAVRVSLGWASDERGVARYVEARAALRRRVLARAA